MENSRGFTLIELLVTIAVLAIITVMAVPSFRNIRDKQKVDYWTKDFEKTLVQTRYDAILHRKKMTINLGLGGVSNPTSLYWQPPADLVISFREFKCQSGKWTGSIVSGVDKLEFTTQGNAKLSKATLDNVGNSQREDVALSAIEVALSNSYATNFIEISPFGKVIVKKESKEGQGCS